MHRPSRLLVITLVAAIAALLTWCSCGSGSADPTESTNAGYAALGRSDWTAAQAEFEKALAHLKPTDAGYVRAKMGQVEALIYSDAGKARDEFLGLAKALPTSIGAKDYKVVGSKLTSERKYVIAIDVVDVGRKACPDDQSLKQVMDKIIEESKKTNDPEALEKLKGLGYIG